MKSDEARAALKALDEQKPPYTVREVAKELRLALQAKAAKRK
jgi:hypothetical protein